MPDISMPDGTVVRFPDDMPKDQIKSLIQRKYPDAFKEPVGTMEDVARSGMSGLRQGVESTLGMFGDAAKMTGDALAWGAGKLGAGDGAQDMIRTGARYLNIVPNAPTTEQIQGLTNPVIGEAYQPQTLAGEYARTIGQFAPAAAAGPGSLGRKAAMTVVPAVTSETAGQLARASGFGDYEQFFRAGGAIAGGIASAGRTNAAKEAARGAPSREALKQQADDLYGQMRQAGIKYDANAYGRSVLDMARDLRKAGFRDSTAKEAYDVVRELAGEVRNGYSPDFDDINGLIQSIGDKSRAAYRAGDNSLGAAYDIIRDNLDELERVAPMVSRTPMPKAQFTTLRRQARQTALQNIKARALEEIMTKADTYQAGHEAGIRNGINNLLRSKKGLQLFRGEERQALLDVAQGRKALRTLSKFGLDITRVSGNSTFIPTVGAAAASGYFSPIAAGSLLAAGTVAKQASPYLTERAFNTAAAGIRSGKMAGQKVAETVKGKNLEAMIRFLLASAAGEKSASANSPRLQTNPQ